MIRGRLRKCPDLEIRSIRDLISFSIRLEIETLLTHARDTGVKVHAILGIRPVIRIVGPGSDSQDRMDQQEVKQGKIKPELSRTDPTTFSIRTLERFPIPSDRNARSISLFYRIFLSIKGFHLIGKSSRPLPNEVDTLTREATASKQMDRTFSPIDPDLA
jgi:hypothetical protein